ncbi:MAG: hypothetical protein RLZZ172_2213, partial [Bacteroidota bacterium]
MSSSYSNTGSYSPENKKDNKPAIIIVLLIALVGSWVYFMYDRNQSTSLIAQKDAQYATLDSSKNAVQKEYDDAIVRLQELTASNNGLDSLVKTKDSELSILKNKFRSIVGKQNATAADLAEARKLVGELNTRIDDYIKEINRLQAENEQLTVDKQNLTTENQTLNSNLANTESARKEAENKVDIGSTLHASGFNIVAI